MDGRPVWLASVSLRDKKGSPILTPKWSEGTMRRAQDALHAVVAGIGDPERERCFRMQVTVCLHRALSDSEIARLPDSWHRAPPVDLAGGPVEILWSKGIRDIPSCKPCVAPTKTPISALTGVRNDDPDAWFPNDCGTCEPCHARTTIHDAAMAEWRASQRG